MKLKRFFVFGCFLLVGMLSLQAALPEGLVQSVEAIIAQKPEQQALWEKLKQSGYVSNLGSDVDNRPAFVSLQATVEQVLAEGLEKKELEKLTVVFHTPLPPTPLRKDPDVPIQEGLVDSSISKDPKRLATVMDRPAIVRRLLAAGAQVTTAYRQWESINEEPVGMEIFRTLKAQYPNLVDAPILSSKDPRLQDSEWVGASYWITSSDKKTYFFSIKATQAKSPQTFGEMAFWLGELDEKASTLTERSNFADRFLDVEYWKLDSHSKK